MKDYGAFRKLLEDEELVYLFNDDTGVYDVYQGYNRSLPRARDFLISVPAQVARRNVAEAHDLIRTALELKVMFG